MRFFVICVALLGVLASAVSAQDSAKAMLDAASKKAATAKGKNGDELNAILKEAAALYEQVPVKFAGSKAECAKAQLEAGRLRKRAGDLAGAEPLLKQAAAATDEPAVVCDALQDLATLYRRTKRLPEAQQALERIVTEFHSEPRERAEALSRLAGMHRTAKQYDKAEACLRQILSDHGELWSPSVEALDDLVTLKLAQGQEAEAKKMLQAHAEALKAHFHGTRYEGRVQPTLDRISLRFKIHDEESE